MFRMVLRGLASLSMGSIWTLYIVAVRYVFGNPVCQKGVYFVRAMYSGTVFINCLVGILSIPTDEANTFYIYQNESLVRNSPERVVVVCVSISNLLRTKEFYEKLFKQPIFPRILRRLLSFRIIRLYIGQSVFKVFSETYEERDYDKTLPFFK